MEGGWYNSSTLEFRCSWVKVGMLLCSLCTWHCISFFQLRGLWFSSHGTKYQYHAVGYRPLLLRLTKSQAPPHRHFSLWDLPVDHGRLQANSKFWSQGSYFRLSIIKQDWRQCIKWTKITRAPMPEIYFVSPENSLEKNHKLLMDIFRLLCENEPGT